MITWYTGDMFLDPAPILVNTVNCVGVMGKGIALEFKRRFPTMFHHYRTACHRGQVQIGEMFSMGERGRHIINFPTKVHWRDPSEYPWIASGLKALRAELLRFQPLNPDVAMPAIGCSNGRLQWEVVKKMIWDELYDLPHHIRVFTPLT